jgi:hypothetical protein
VQCFADELAHIAGRDPLDYLLDLIGPPRILNLNGANYPNYGASYKTYPIDAGRLRQVLELAAEKSGWAKRKPGDGTGWGIAVHRSFVTYVATVVQIEVNEKGELRIPRVDMAVDAGLIVDPMLVRTQFEGAAVFGTSVARSGEITATNGVIDQSNFYDFRSRGLMKRHSKPMSISSNRALPPEVWGNRACRLSMRRFVMPFTRRPANWSGNCRCRGSTLRVRLTCGAFGPGHLSRRRRLRWLYRYRLSLPQ